MTGEQRVELTIQRTRADYFWGLLFEALQGRFLWLAILIPPAAEATLALRSTEGAETALRVQEVITRGGVALVVVLALVAVLYLLIAALSWRAPGYLAPISYVFSSDGVRGQTQATSTETAWIAYRRAFETRSLLILSQAAGIVQIIPKRDLPSQTLNAVRRLLREHLGRRAQVQEIMP